MYMCTDDIYNEFLSVGHSQPSSRNTDLGEAIQMVGRMDTWLFKKQVQQSGLFSLKGRRLQDDIRAVFQSLKDCHEEERMALFSVISGDGFRGGSFEIITQINYLTIGAVYQRNCKITHSKSA